MNAVNAEFLNAKPLKLVNGMPGISHAIAFHPYGSRRSADTERNQLMRTVYCKLYKASGYSMDHLDEKGITHSSLGQPLIKDWSHGVDELSPDHHISFSHDGEFHVALGAVGSQLIGVGVDIVHLNRLTRKRPGLSTPLQHRNYILHLARRVLTDSEWILFARRSASMDMMGLAVQFASLFSIKESVSKSLGVGLKLGLGIGNNQSIQLQSISIRDDGSFITLFSDGEKRMKELGGGKIWGEWSLIPGYLISRAFIMR